MLYQQGIITESKSGRRAILADRVIDCTGDADVAYLAGAEYRFVILHIQSLKDRGCRGPTICFDKSFFM